MSARAKAASAKIRTPETMASDYSSIATHHGPSLIESRIRSSPGTMVIKMQGAGNHSCRTDIYHLCRAKNYMAPLACFKQEYPGVEVSETSSRRTRC